MKPRLILGSKSPRRQELLKNMGLSFTVRISDADEVAPSGLSPQETAVWVAKQKAESLRPTLAHDELLITADTEVWLGNYRFGKPANETEARKMLYMLSGKTHVVVGGVCLTTLEKQVSFFDNTYVTFRPLDEKTIDHYIKNYRPFDKAGAYGVQEWIGLVAIEKIEGSYFNVVGLPTQKLFLSLIKTYDFRFTNYDL